jgi:hypothetical protein
MQSGPSHFGLLPGTDEAAERILNALSTYISAAGFGAMRTIEVDGAGNQINPAATAFAVIDAATSGDNTLVAANTTKKIRVTSLFLVSAGTVNVRFESAAGGTALTGQMNLIANTGFCLPYNPAGWFQTAVNELLNLELSGAISVDGSLTYVLV